MTSEKQTDLLTDDNSPVQLEDIRLAEAASNSPVQLPDEPSDGVESNQQQKASSADVIIRVAKDTSLRRLINYVIYKIEHGQTVTIQALHVCVHKAVMLAGIVRDRVGNVHMLNSLLVVNEKRASQASENSEGQEQADTRKSEKTLTGIQIILSLKQLDDTQLGYQRPKPAGFASFGIRRPMNPRRETYRPRPRFSEEEQPSDIATRSRAPREQPQTENHEARAARPRQERRQKPKQKEENDVQEGEDLEQKRRKNRKSRRSAAKKTQEKETSAEEKPAENSQRERVPRPKRAKKEQSDSTEESNGAPPARDPTSQNQSGEYHYDSNNFRRGEQTRRPQQQSGYDQRLYDNHRQYNDRRSQYQQDQQYRYQGQPAGRRGGPSYGLQSQGSGHYRPQTNYGAYERQNYGYSTSYHNQRYQGSYGYQGSDQRRQLQRYSENHRQSGYLQGARNPRKPNEIEDFYSPNGVGASSTHQRRVTAVQYPRE